MSTLREVKMANKQWFASGNKKFFGDISYQILHGKKSKKPYLVRSTYQWSDMFRQESKLCWRVNTINEYLDIGSLIGDVFESLSSVKSWLQDK